jgi:hypothetical protein
MMRINWRQPNKICVAKLGIGISQSGLVRSSIYVDFVGNPFAVESEAIDMSQFEAVYLREGDHSRNINPEAPPQIHFAPTGKTP